MSFVAYYSSSFAPATYTYGPIDGLHFIVKDAGGQIIVRYVNGDDTGYVAGVPYSKPLYIVKLFLYSSGGYIAKYAVLSREYDQWSLIANVLPDYEAPDVINVSNDKFYADGLSALNNTLSDVLDKMRDRLGLDTDVDVPVSVPSDKVDDKLRDVTQDDVLGKDIATEDDKAKDEDTNKDKDTTPPKPPTLPDLSLPEIIFKEKFPFCLPWDLYLAFSNLAAPAEPPKWEIPFEIKSLNLKQDITIDFSQFDTLASVLRWGLSVAFVIWLVLLTRKIIGQ